MANKDIIMAPAGEAFLIFVAAAAGFLLHQPLIFASLGPTAYELIETPHRRTSRPYCILVGHLIGIASAWLALLMTHAWSAPPVSASVVPFLRVCSIVVAAALTVFLTLLFQSAQPAAVSTTILIASGLMQTARDAVAIMAAVVLVLIVGEPLRRLRLHQQEIRKSSVNQES